MNNVFYAESGCWEWTLRTNNKGYGLIRISGENQISTYAHRVSYVVFKGPVPDGKQIDHLCRNRICVNPDHLEAVTAQVNVLRGNTVSAVNAAKTHCVHGHAFDPDNTKFDKRGRRSCRQCLRNRSLAYRSPRTGGNDA